MKKNNITKYIVASAPYLGVLVGMYWFKNAFFALLIYHFIILIYILKKRKHLNINDLFKINNKLIFILFSITCALTGLIIYVLKDFIFTHPMELKTILQAYGLHQHNIWIFIIYFSTINPVLEELFWRILFNSNNKIISFSDIGYASYHILVVLLFIKPEFVLVTYIGLLIAARIWRYIYDKYNDSLTLFISHALADLSVMLAVLYLL